MLDHLMAGSLGVKNVLQNILEIKETKKKK